MEDRRVEEAPTIGPGYFRTDLTAGRCGTLDDLTGATVFLCSDAARYVTGQLLYIDGGYMASI